MGTISSCVETRDGGAVYGTGAPVRTDYRDQRRPSADDAKNGTNPHGLRDMPVGATRFAIGPARRMPLRCPLPHATSSPHAASQPPGGSLGGALCCAAPGVGRKGGVPSLVQLARPQVPCRRGAHTRVSGNQPKWERLSGNWPALRCPAGARRTHTPMPSHSLRVGAWLHGVVPLGRMAHGTGEAAEGLLRCKREWARVCVRVNRRQLVRRLVLRLVCVCARVHVSVCACVRACVCVGGDEGEGLQMPCRIRRKIGRSARARGPPTFGTAPSAARPDQACPAAIRWAALACAGLYS